MIIRSAPASNGRLISLTLVGWRGAEAPVRGWVAAALRSTSVAWGFPAGSPISSLHPHRASGIIPCVGLPLQHTRRGRRRSAALAFVSAGTAASEGPPGQPPATPGAARQRRQRVCRGFQGAFFSGGGCGRLVAGVAGRLVLLLCAGELEGERGKRQPVEHHS